MKELDDTQEVELPQRGEKRAQSQTIARPPADRVQLVVVAGARVGQTFPVQHSTLIGRAEEASVQIDDAEISRRHALVRNIGDDRYVIEDLESRNGTVVNGMRVERSELHLGDRIQLGSRFVLQFVRHERIEDVLRHQQRLETLGRLCVGVAHDLNNMLAVILTNLECLELELGEVGKPSAVVGDCLDDLKTATDHAAKLTPRLLAFGRADERHMMRVDLSALCSDLVPVLRRSLPRNIDVQAEIKPSLAVNGIAADLQQVLMNLCVNARDAMKGGGTLRIEARLEPPTQSGSPRRIGIHVSDTGEGMDEAVRTRIFEPFFTTKKRGAGSGLGLATVRDIVTAHGGDIEVRSAPGAGSTFVIRFPSVEPSRRRTAASLRSTELPAPSRTILIVGDEALLRRSFRRILERHGHSVVEVADGAAALASYGEVKPDLVIVDLDSCGVEEGVVAELRRIDPDARILVQQSNPRRSAEELGALAYLPAPLSPAQLLADINRALRES